MSSQIASVIKSASELKTAMDGLVIAGSKHVHNVALKQGMEAVNPEDVLGANEKNAIAEQVAGISASLDDCFVEMALSESTRETLLGFAVKLSFREIGFDEVCKGIGIARSFEKSEAVSSTASRLEMERSSTAFTKIGRAVQNRILSRRPFFLDFSSQSAKKLVGRSEILPLKLFLPKSNQSHLSIQSQNLIQHLKRLRSGQRVRLTIPFAERFQHIPLDWQRVESALQKTISPLLSYRITARLAAAYVEFGSAKHALVGFLNHCERKPEYASFNNFGSMELSGFGAAAKEVGLPVKFTSHGAMIAHGEPPRKLLTSILSRAIFNEPACATELSVRSKLQVSQASNLPKIKPKVRLTEKPIVPTQSNRPFRIYLAPNFLSWYGNYHGLTHSCFEADRCIRSVVRAVSSSKELVVDLRLKTSAIDLARKKLKEPDRGLLPSDITDLFDERNGIFDACYGSHSAYMENADLVVTEGVTAVTFEALEMRKPLLFVNQYSDREAALPARRVRGSQTFQRSATYCCSIDDDIKQILHRLRQLHLGKPLTNNELSGLIWV